MEEMVIREDNPLWFVDESADLMEYSEGGLANQIFGLAESRILKEQRDIFKRIIEVSPIVAEMAKKLEKTQHLKLVFSDEVKEKMAAGIYRLMNKKDDDGIFKAVVVDTEGKTRAIADLKWEDISKAVDPSKLTSAMQGVAIQQQLHDIADKLEDMSVTMEEVLVGQFNDRLAKFYSGEAIYREALATKDPERKKQLTSAAIMSLTEAIASLQTNLAYEIMDIRGRYDAEKEKFIGIKTEALKEKMFLVNSSFQTIHKATTLKAAIYYDEQEYSALLAVISDYKSFLERSLTEENANILYLADPNEKNIDGSWNMRKNELPARIDRAKELLSEKKEYALEVEMEDVI